MVGYNKRMQVTSSERGAVSIFLVIFFALLISVITMSFIGIVIRGADQSTNSDLSRSAFDSAQAGVEDAKRAVALYSKECAADPAGPTCGSYTTFINNQTCGALPGFAGVLGLHSTGGNEINVQGTDNSALDQAYTCVNIVMNTPDYINSKQPYTSDVIPLKAVASVSSTTAVHPASFTLNWFTHSDAGLADTQGFSPRLTGVDQLPTEAAWGQDTPALMRVELISYTDGAPITDAGLQASTKTLYLYPSVGGATEVGFDTDTPPASGNTPPIVAINCSGGAGATYACSAKLDLGTNQNKTSFLRVTPLYKKATFQLQLTDAFFNGVQPIVDSTGRANDLFRRVQARVRLQNNVVYPEYAVDSGTTLCKDFSVGAAPADFKNQCGNN